MNVQTEAVPREYAEHLEQLRADLPDLAADIAGFTGIEHVLTWMHQTGRAQSAIDIVGQDEFSYDFLVELEAGGRWLAFGVT